MNTAETISFYLGDNGQCWETDEGDEFADLMVAYFANAEWRDGYRSGDCVRYTFPDGSVIIEANGCWDLGYPDCFCMQGAPDIDNCPIHKR